MLYNECTLDLWPDTVLRDVIYFILGFTGVVLLGTYHYECGVSLEPPCGQLWWQRILHVFRMTLSLWLLILCWEGFYEIIDVKIESKWTYSAHIIVGNFLGLLSDSLEYPINIPQRETLYKNSLPMRDKVWLWLAGFLSLIGDIVCWVGVDNILVDYDKPPEEQYVSTKVIYLCTGAIIMYLTKTLPNHAHLVLSRFRPQSVVPGDTSQSSTSTFAASISVFQSVAWPSSSPGCCSLRRICVAVQRIAGSLAYFAFWAGVESMFYYHGFDNPIDTEKSKLLELLTAGIGLVCMYAAGSLAFVAFPCGTSDRAWPGIRNSESAYISNVLRPSQSH